MKLKRLVLRLLLRRCGQLSHEQELAVRALPLEKLEALAKGGLGANTKDLRHDL